MLYKFIKTNSFIALSLTVATMGAILSLAPNTAQAQYRRVYLEEFTGAWCGFCPRGAYAINNLYATYPGQVAVVSIHSDQGSSANDMMDVPQGDSLVSDIGFPSTEALTGFPDGWTARSIPSGATTWNVDPSQWATGIAAEFGLSVSDGIVADELQQPVEATVTVDNISYNSSTQQVTARVSVTFAQAESGDLRLNLMVTEDSVSGSGSGWDQHNYYSSAGSVGPSVPGNPLYSLPASIPGWQHMHVFREAVGGIHGQAGIIPASVKAGSNYSTTFTFTLPSNIQDTNHVHLIGLVSAYSATDASGNTVFDAEEVPLIGPAPKYFITNLLLTPQTQYATATSNATTADTILITNNDASDVQPVTLNLSVDASQVPAGWSVKLASDTVTVAPGATVNAILNVTAPEQSAFTSFNVIATPIKEGYIVSSMSTTQYMLSNNTRCPIFYDPASVVLGTAETALISAVPDSLQLYTAEVPLSDGSVAAYPPETYPISIFDNVMILDNGGSPNLTNPTILPNIVAALAAGNKVFISSDYALGYAFDQSNAYFAQFAGYTETQEVQSFYQQIGLDFTATTERFNANTGASLTFSIKGVSNDPVGNNISATDAGGYFSCVYSIDSASTPSFYSDGKSKNIIGSTYIDSSSNARLVYLGFGLKELTETSLAKTIATNSIKWLLSNSTAGVNDPAAGVVGMTASPNPFHGITQINYVASQGEQNVSFAAYDVLGREVSVLPAQSEGNNSYIATFDGSKLADGTYVIVAHSSKGTSQVRVVNQQ